MKRIADQYLLEWLKSKNRKPLVIRGARQVGKSTLVRNFAEQANRTLYEINLEKNLKLDAVFRRLNITEIVRELEIVAGQGQISGEKGILFLDEIQAVPSAIPALRYFFEECPNLPVIAAGSLLEFALADANFSMPVGRIEYLYLGPLAFTEFLRANGEDQLIEYLRNSHLNVQPIESAHNKLLGRLREYLLVGGMPEAVKVYSAGGGFPEVFKIHDSIMDTYREDFSKYARHEDLIRLQKIFDYIPSGVGRKFKPSNIDPLEKSLSMRRSAELLMRAGIFNPVAHTSCSGIPLSAGADINKFKPLFLDIGLMNSIRGTHDLSPEKLVTRQFINEGSMAEQFIGQHLLYFNGSGKRPAAYYWVREERASGAEVDFIVTFGETIIPIEVKAGLSGSLKSLLQFVAQKKSRLCVRFDQHQPSQQDIGHEIKGGSGTIRVEFRFLSLPLYMIEELSRLIAEALQTH